MIQINCWALNWILNIFNLFIHLVLAKILEQDCYKEKALEFQGLGNWCRQRDSNSRPTDYKSVALPTELCRHKKTKIFQINFIQINTIILKSSYHRATTLITVSTI